MPAGAGTGGAKGEIRVFKPVDRVRMTWQPDGWPAPATLQLTVSASRSGKTAVHATWKSSPDADVRETMRARWCAALERIVGGLDKRYVTV